MHGKVKVRPRWPSWFRFRVGVRVRSGLGLGKVKVRIPFPIPVPTPTPNLVLRDHALGDHLRGRGGERPAEVAVPCVVEDPRLTAWLA